MDEQEKRKCDFLGFGRMNNRNGQTQTFLYPLLLYHNNFNSFNQKK